MYRVSRGSDDIGVFEVFKSTEKTVTYMTDGHIPVRRTEYKKSSSHTWFESWEDARDALVNWYENKANRYANKIDYYTKRIYSCNASIMKLINWEPTDEKG